MCNWCSERKREIEIFEEIMANNFPKLMKTTNYRYKNLRKPQFLLKKEKTNKKTLKHSIVKLLKKYWRQMEKKGTLYLEKEN